METEVLGLDRRLGRLEDAVKEFRFDMNGRLLTLDGRVTSIDGKMDRQFRWMVGLMLSALVAVVIALIRH